MGKTHMVEFAFGGTGQNSHHGAPYNPWDATAHRSVGGSSSGAGVSLLEGSAVLAFGSDTAGFEHETRERSGERSAFAIGTSDC